MKTAISIADDVFAAADEYARATGKSRSQLYTEAVREYLATHSPDAVTEALNAVYRDTPAGDDFTREAARRILEGVEW